VFRHIVSVPKVALVVLTSRASNIRLWWYRRCHNPKDPFGKDNAMFRSVLARDPINRDFIRTGQAT
jgi:hypothetical protein